MPTPSRHPTCRTDPARAKPEHGTCYAKEYCDPVTGLECQVVTEWWHGGSEEGGGGDIDPHHPGFVITQKIVFYADGSPHSVLRPSSSSVD